MLKRPFIGVRSTQSPLIGRDKELQLFLDLLEQVGVDQGQILGVVAPAGMGKSRIVAAYKELTTQHSSPLFVGTFTKNYQPYEAFREIVSQMTGSDIDTLAKWSLTETEVDYLRLLLEPNAEIESLKTLSETDIRQGLFSSIKKLIFSRARTPMVIILDDLHWAGQDSHDLLEFLVNDTEFTRLLLVVVSRPDIQLTWTKRLNYTEVKLAPFDKLQIERMIRNVLDIDSIDSRVTDELIRVSHGNPFFIEEMLKHMFDTGAIEIIHDPQDHSKFLLLRESASSMPQSIYSLIESRLKTLPLKSREALEWAALFGNPSDTDELSMFLQEKWNEDPKAHLQPLFKNGYLIEKSAFPTRTYRFGHDLFFETVHSLIPKDGLPNLHLQIGDFLTKYHQENAVYFAHRIAEHYVQSPSEVPATKFLHQAGINALKLYHYSEALYHFEKAYPFYRRNYISDLKEGDFYIPYLETLLACGRINEAEDILGKWGKQETGFSEENRIQYLRLLTELYNQKSDHRKIIDITQVIKDNSGQNKNYEKLFFETSHSRINAFIFMGKIDHAIHEGLETLKRLEESGLSSIKMRLWARLAYCSRVKNQLGIALDYLDKAEAHFSENLPPLLQIELMARFTNIYIELKEHDQAQRMLSQMIEISKKYGLRRSLANSLIKRGFYFFNDADEYSRAISDLNEALKEGQSIKDESLLTEAGFLLTEVLLDIGAKEQALATWWGGINTKQPSDQWQQIAFNYLQAMFASFKGDFHNYALLYRKNAQLNLSVYDRERAVSYLFGALTVECEHRLRPLSDIESEFFELANQAPQNSALAKWSRTIAAYCLSAYGIKTEDMIDNFDFRTCDRRDLRQLLYVWKIRWLDSKGLRQEASELREIYKKERENIAKKIPEKYRTDFLIHPLYRVP